MSTGRTKPKKRPKGASAPGSPTAGGPAEARADGPRDVGAAAASAPSGAQSEASLLDAAPDLATRRRTLAVLALWALVQVAIPLRYYLGDDLYDERFAWRMFSAVRVQECDIAVTETRGGREVALAPMSFLPAPWVGLLERSRPAVVRGFLDWRCGPRDESEDPAPELVAVRSECVDARGDALPPVLRELDCGTHRYEERALREPVEVAP